MGQGCADSKRQALNVAIYFLNLRTFGRSNGSSAVSAAAYRSGERIRDERTGVTYDHTDRQDILHKEIILPSEFSGDAVAWAHDRNTLWNSAEDAESRVNARVAREFLGGIAPLDPHGDSIPDYTGAGQGEYAGDHVGKKGNRVLNPVGEAAPKKMRFLG